ncbi:RNA-binding domain-containing protein [Aureobasidium sp. EXF-8845]|nr:RNA-binding domain-containing protein [Aureobasidium sp. EXF-8845]KAI4839644.1 RNA-binding domain-containing protein [Aureobasidium sp. EXF-8846]
MNQIKQVQRLNERELEKVVPSNASWHTDYRDTAYIYVGGLNLDLSEGDIITIFSQYGEPVWIRLMRDKETGKSKGFCWLKYEDQRSCDLAVDNLGGATVMGKMLAVDHTRYKKRDDEDEDEGYVGQDKEIAGADAEESEAEEEARPLIKEEIELAKLMRDMEDDDPMKAYMIEQKKEEVEKALAKSTSLTKRDDSRREKRHHRSRRDHDDDRHRRHRRDSSRTDDRHIARVLLALIVQSLPGGTDIALPEIVMFPLRGARKTAGEETTQGRPLLQSKNATTNVESAGVHLLHLTETTHEAYLLDLDARKY